jgi:membrane fusion protein (multidrug efflux system)
MRTESEIQVARGLNVGDTVITSGILQLRPGTAIEITNLKN